MEGGNQYSSAPIRIVCKDYVFRMNTSLAKEVQATMPRNLPKITQDSDNRACTCVAKGEHISNSHKL